MVNLSKLQDIGQLNITQNLTDTNVLSTAVSTANSTTDGYYGIGVGICLYLILLFISTKKDSLFSLDSAKASVLSSGVVIVLMIILLNLDMISSFMHLMWFVLIFLISLVIVYANKDKE